MPLSEDLEPFRLKEPVLMEGNEPSFQPEKQRVASQHAPSLSLDGVNYLVEFENAAVFVAALAASKTIPLDSADKVDRARLTFTSSWLFALAIIIYIYYKIYRLQLSASSTLQPKSNCAGSPTKRVTRRQTLQAADLAAIVKHDRLQLRGLLKDQAKSLFIIALLHAYLGKPGPLFLQTALPPWRVLTSNLFKVYVLGRTSTGPLERPWQDNSLMSRIRGFAIATVKAKVVNVWKKDKAS